MTTAIVEFDPFEAQMTEFRTRYSGVVYDLTVPAQEKQARSDRYAIGQVISALDAAHSGIKAPLLERTRVIDGERKRIKDELLAIQGKIKEQIDARDAQIKAKVDAIRALAFEPLDTPTVAQVAERLEKLQEAAINLEAGYEDCKEDAALAVVETTAKLKIMHKQALERDELERLRKEQADRERAKRDERIRKEAAERATREAEEKAKRDLDTEKRRTADAEAATLRAEQESKAAAERATKAERERVEKEQREAAAKAGAKRKAEEARKAKTAHRAKIHKEAATALVAHGIGQAVADQVIALIAEPSIIHVRMEY